ncbi:MAG: TonB family protein [bacterium]
MANIAVTLPHRDAYGAPELKENIRKHTIRGFIISISAFLIFLIVYTILTNRDTTVPMAPVIPMNRIQLEKLADEENPEEKNAPQEIQNMVNTGPAARAGNPVPAPDSEITPDMKDFASIEDINRSSSKGGDGIDNGGFADNIDLGKELTIEKAIEKIPEYGQFQAVEENPKIANYADLKKSVVYPDIAKRAGVEGKVTVAVYIDKYGKPKRTKILESPNSLLDQAAIDAVMRYTGYTPAIQSKQPVGCWLSIPINFTLR